MHLFCQFKVDYLATMNQMSINRLLMGFLSSTITPQKIKLKKKKRQIKQKTIF